LKWKAVIICRETEVEDFAVRGKDTFFRQKEQHWQRLEVEIISFLEVSNSPAELEHNSMEFRIAKGNIESEPVCAY
jgi:hypothetical protein